MNNEILIVALLLDQAVSGVGLGRIDQIRIAILLIYGCKPPIDHGVHGEDPIIATGY